jgi:hypothetical protein
VNYWDTTSLKNQLLAQSSEEVEDNSLIVFDLTDVAKPYSMSFTIEGTENTDFFLRALCVLPGDRPELSSRLLHQFGEVRFPDLQLWSPPRVNHDIKGGKRVLLLKFVEMDFQERRPIMVTRFPALTVRNSSWCCIGYRKLKNH